MKSANAGRPKRIESRTGPIHIALTGTAIQNDYMELWTLLDWCNPGKVGTKSQWKRAVVQPLTRGQSKGSTEEERIKGQVRQSMSSTTGVACEFALTGH